MPKAAAIQPNEWATIHDNFVPFDIGALNRVVLDYAHIELTLAKRWHRRTVLGRTVAVAGYSLQIIGLMAAVTLALILLTGAIDNEALLPVVWAGAALSAYAVVGRLVPWLLTPYRQWDRTLFGLAVMVSVIAVVSLGAALFRSWEAAPGWAVAVPCAVLLAVMAAVMVVHGRYRVAEKPPAVDLATLSPAEIELLRKVRRRALVVLRSRNVVSYKDFNGYDNAPLNAPPAATEARA
ncbi:hypothetical protein [Glycomyces tenuis]|uniref:hypothetical protein n=1 Tax=Glycomyces tenuis TaxID=58116 RepID=UPI000401A756|nr:hypothetical protein [Glycomyces tenuis]